MTPPVDGNGDGAVPGPHDPDSFVAAGAPRGAARAAVVALHGRGATAQGIVNLLDPVARHGVAFVAPRADRSRWYPGAADDPLERNEPHLSSALGVVESVLDRVASTVGVPRERTVLLGFSQGACVAAEYAARNPGPSPVVVLSGTLLGPTADADRYAGGERFDGTPVFVGCGADDARVDAGRVRDTADVFRSLGADVTERRYDGVGHEVTDDEFEYVDALLAGLVEDRDPG
ncbi:phospholipase/carboxylesterase [Halogeometricum pallidum JCM 14848]|uniref:Phospholipase/carboxylesterase n=1 Tax=Halogeometricum pallidum JCM 14848 TaxID=1227487 RepID=M0D803_HALPD|nr:dienelactone hydrolase family protein [Halogeometricum pallidum]ELZ31596.1 phospholipase/carboxylesterase [Halogeometricum pallidum JCM 14848]